MFPLGLPGFTQRDWQLQATREATIIPNALLGVFWRDLGNSKESAARLVAVWNVPFVVFEVRLLCRLRCLRQVREVSPQFVRRGFLQIRHCQ